MSELQIGTPPTIDHLIKTNKALYGRLRDKEDELTRARDCLAQIREYAEGECGPRVPILDLLDRYEEWTPLPRPADAELLASGNAMLMERCEKLAALVEKAFRSGHSDAQLFSAVILDRLWPDSDSAKELADIMGGSV